MIRDLTRAALFAGAIGLAVSLAAPAARAQTSETEADTVVATVNGNEIYFSEVVMLLNSLPERFRQIPLPAIYPQLVRQLVNQRLIADAARAENYGAQEDVKSRMAFLEQRVLQEFYLTERIDAGLTEERLRQRYDERNAARTPAVEVRARHILLKTEDEAIAVIEELDGGAEFEQLAKDKSTGPSAAQGGDLGYFTEDQMVKEFSEAAFAMEPGETSSAPVQTSFGWHVIKIEDRRETAPPSFEDSVEEMRNEVAQQIVSDIVEELREGADIQGFNLDGTPLELAE